MEVRTGEVRAGAEFPATAEDPATEVKIPANPAEADATALPDAEATVPTHNEGHAGPPPGEAPDPPAQVGMPTTNNKFKVKSHESSSATHEPSTGAPRAVHGPAKSCPRAESPLKVTTESEVDTMGSNYQITTATARPNTDTACLSCPVQTPEG